MTAEAGASLSAAFAAALGGSALEGPAAAALLGLEHEYQLFAGGERLDFRRLIHRLPIEGRRLDPGDANAYRLNSGLVLTCDEAEAEVASPPLAVTPGFTAAIAAWSAAGRAELQRLLLPGLAVQGYSTHLSASLPEYRQREVLLLFARVFAPVLMLLFDGPASLGVYVRPRPGRLELCGDHLDGGYLRATSAFFAGAVRACAAAIAGDANGERPLPPALDVGLRPATGRFGLYVGRRLAFGFDLYAEGRRAILPLAGGGVISAQAQLSLAWQAARDQLSNRADAADLDVADRIVAGDLPLRVEGAAEEHWLEPLRMLRPSQEGLRITAFAPTSEAESRVTHPLGDVLRSRQRPAFVAEVVIATWDFTIFRLAGRRHAFACLPRSAAAAYLRELDAGQLDAVIEAYLAAPAPGRRLTRHEQTQQAGLWDEIGPGLGLLPTEPDPRTGRQEQPAPDPGARAGKAVPGYAAAAPARPLKPPSVEARPGKPAAIAARPGKPAALPPVPAAPIPMAPAPLPPAPVPPAPPPPEQPEPQPPLPPPPPSRPPIIRYVLPVGVLAAVVAGVIAVAGGVFGGGVSPGEETPTRTPTPSPTSDTVTPTPAAILEPIAEPTPTPRPTATPTRTLPPTAAPTEPPRPTAVPTETLRPTATASSTPSPTPTPTPTPTPLAGLCDLTIAKSSDAGSPPANLGLITYTIRVDWICSPGVTTTTGVSVHVDDALPLKPPAANQQPYNYTPGGAPQVTFTSASSGSVGCVGPNHAHGGAPGFNTNRFGCNIGILPANGHAIITLQLDTGINQNLTNTAVVDTDNQVAESNEGNNQSQKTDNNCCP